MKNRNIILQSRKSLGLFLVFGMMMLSFMAVYNVSASSYSLTLTSSGSQSIDVTADANTAISSDAINVTTTCRYGYNFTVQTSVDDTTLYLDGNSDGSAYTYFLPAGGFDPLNETENEWGYFYDGNTVPTNTSIFSPVPSSLEEPAIIKAPLDTPASSDINDNFNIYYGVSVSANAEKGTYKMIPDEHDNDGTIVYIATMAEDCLRYTVSFDPTSTATGSIITGTGTMFDQIMYEDIPEAIINNGFTAPSGYYFAGWNTAQDGSGTFYSDEQVVTNLTGAGDAITLYAIWDNCPGGNICYIANGTNIVGSMGKQTISNTDTEATLYAPNYKRDGYGFVSWNTSPDGLGTNYGPNQTIEFTAGQYSASGLKLYAKWVASTGDIQNWSGCSGMGVGDVTALKDIRDNNVYAVAKLADGKCWMIENLRLADKDSSNNDINLSSTNTHNPSLPLTNRYYSTTSNHLSPPVDPTQTSWCTDETPPCIGHSRLATNNTTLFINNTASNYDISSDVYSYGNYYNWYSATAGHGQLGNTYDYHAPGDICPTGWHLPKGSQKIGEVNNEFWSLIVTGLNNGVKPANYDDTALPYYVGNEAKLVSNILRSYPNNFVHSGMVYRNFWNHHRSYYGRYWSASAFLSGTAFTMHFYDSRSSSSSSDEVNPGTRDEWEFYGMTVRCIAGT